MLILKKPTCLSDKMPPKILLSPIFFRFLILTSLGVILSRRQVCILEISIKFLIFLIPNMTYFKEKIFTSQKGHLSNFLTEEPKKDGNSTK